MDKIKLSSSLKRIQVNENGDFITFDARDQGFMDRLLKLLQEFYDKEGIYQAKVDELRAMPTETDAQRFQQAAAALGFNSELCGWLESRINDVFQDDVKRKVFGDIKPTGEAWAEFFDQLAPIIRIAKSEQSERVRKYTEKYTR